MATSDNDYELAEEDIGPQLINLDDGLLWSDDRLQREIASSSDTSSSSEHLYELQYGEEDEDDELNSNNNNRRATGDFKWTDEARVILANLRQELKPKYRNKALARMWEEISQRMNTLGYKCTPNQARQCFSRMEKKCGELQELMSRSGGGRLVVPPYYKTVNEIRRREPNFTPKVTKSTLSAKAHAPTSKRKQPAPPARPEASTSTMTPEMKKKKSSERQQMHDDFMTKFDKLIEIQTKGLQNMEKLIQLLDK